MKNPLIIILILVLSLPTFAQQKKVAVYVTADESIDETIKRIIGNELIEAISTHPDYCVVERAYSFLKEIQNEHHYQRSGNVEDSQIQELGKQYGASRICVANIVSHEESYYLIQARLLNVETAEIEATAQEITQSNTIKEVEQIAKSLASKLIGQKSVTMPYNRDFSEVTDGLNDFDIISIDNTDSVAIVTFKCINAQTITIKRKISSDTYIMDDVTGTHYKALGSSLSNFFSYKYQSFHEGITSFTITFEKLPENIKSIDIIDPNPDHHFTIKKILLYPYEKANYYLFQDNSKEKYDRKKLEQKINQMIIWM